jgi:hypothetical protein
MKYYIDTEFIEDGFTIELISIGIVCEDGRDFYAENTDCDLNRASDWVKENVIPQLWSRDESKPKYNTWGAKGSFNGLLNKTAIADEIKRFCNPVEHGLPEFWGYYADYDWVVFCQLFGTMMQLPDNYPMYCCDLIQWSKQLGSPQLPVQKQGEHSAIEDARWNQQVWLFLDKKKEVVNDR